MKKLALSLAILGLIAMGGQATAELCTIDAVPAATLLLPYFQVDLDSPTGINTVFSINNASAAPVVAHVTLWTDLSVPTLDFDVALTGYDVVPISLRDIFVDGNLPVTETVNNADEISPFGEWSFDQGNFSKCEENLPFDNPVLKPTALDEHIRNAHTGQASAFFLGDCSGVDYGDRIARGYITIDVVNDCSTLFPDDPDYYTGQGAVVTDPAYNVLWGDYYIVDAANNFAEGDNLVHIETGEFRSQTGYTFYGRYSAGDDFREPLGTTYAARLIQGGGFDGGSNYSVWRDSKVAVSSFECGALEAGLVFPYPLNHTQAVTFDEEENPFECEETRLGPPVSPPPVDVECPPIFPWETQRFNIDDIDDFALPRPAGSGWIYLNLNHTVANAPFNPWAQAWVSATFSAEGRYTVGLAAIQLDSACFPNDLILPVED